MFVNVMYSIHLLLVTAAIILVAYGLSDEQQWHKFKLKHGKSYKSIVEERTRFNIFQRNLRLFEDHNERYARGEVTYKVGITVFADVHEDEFDEKGFNPFLPTLLTDTNRVKVILNSDESLPKAFNWNELGAVTKSRNQGHCNACWAFVAASAVESRIYIKTGVLEELSPQNILDCANAFGGLGCAGGSFNVAFNYIEDYGILPDKEYPYAAMKEKCLRTGGIKIDGFINLENDYRIIEYFLVKNGPICTGISVGKQLYYYTHGIVDEKSGCKNTEEYLEHAVLLVGYGSENGVEYWIVKNSWGTDWGENGFFRIKKGDDNVCGINLLPSYPILT